MSMATSLETRAPFLDARMMELAFSMPGELKIRNGTRNTFSSARWKGCCHHEFFTGKRRASAFP